MRLQDRKRYSMQTGYSLRKQPTNERLKPLKHALETFFNMKTVGNSINETREGLIHADSGKK